MANYSVYKADDGEWKAKRDDATRAGSSSRTQSDAIDDARRFAAGSGGGDISIHGVDGKIRAKDTVPPGNDPRSIPG